ncbi:GNAT family N-acetyltransferase [Patescibacteria group bacterium]
MEPKHSSSPDTKEEEKPPLPVKSLVKKGSFFMPQRGLFHFYPHYFKQTLTRGQQHYYSTNGHSSLLKSLQVEVFSQIDDCQRLWQEFSLNTTLFDTWDFRLAFWKGYHYEPYFLVLKNGPENLALLPLQYEKDKKRYTWFGSMWQEENKFLVKDPLFIPLLLAISPSPIILNAISTDLPSWAEKVIKLKPDDPKYILKLDTIKFVDDYLATLKKKKRYNLKRDQRIIQDQNPQIIINRFEDFDDLIRLSLERFHGKGEDADWEDHRRVKTFRQVIKLGQTTRDYQIRMISVVIGKKIASVDLIALFKNCYSPLKCGYDVKSFPGIGNFVNLLEINDAISLGMKKMDFLEIGYGWKEKWFEAVPLLQYEKK